MTSESIYDHHLHFFQEAASLDVRSLGGFETKDRVVALLRGLDDDFSIISDWSNSKIPFENGELDDLPPLVLINVSYHGCFVNNPGRQFLAKEHALPLRHLQAPIGSLANSRLVGMIRETLLRFSQSKGEACLERFRSVGICGFDDMGFGRLEPDIEAFMLSRDDCRFYVDTDLLLVLKREKPELFARISGMKCFMDGALGTRSAMISCGYDNGSNGTVYLSQPALKASMEFAAEQAKAIAVHAIGDVAIDKTLQVIQELGRMRPRIPHIRIEHAQFISEKSARLAKELDVVLCMQPNFSSDSVDYLDRLPETFLQKNNPFRMLIDQVGFTPGEDLLFGSDGMPYGLEPALSIAVNPPVPSQRLSKEELLRGYTAREGDNS